MIAWALFVLVLIWFLVYPFFGSRFMVSNLTLFALYLPVALGLSLLWGYMGVLSFGQMAFFGIGGYVYGLLSINLQNMIGGTIISMVGGLVATFSYMVVYSWMTGPSRLLTSQGFLQVLVSGTVFGMVWFAVTALMGRISRHRLEKELEEVSD
jgi:ABC-type branched-subunit amino acid transport system permease subunit